MAQSRRKQGRAEYSGIRRHTAAERGMGDGMGEGGRPSNWLFGIRVETHSVHLCNDLCNKQENQKVI